MTGVDTRLCGLKWGVQDSRNAHQAEGTQQDVALAGDVFDKFCNAVTFKSIMALHRQLCELLKLRPTYFPSFYTKLKAKLRSWKAQALWSKFDKRASHRCYSRGRACPNTRVLIIGGGPCGLRTAIEAQLLGSKVVVVEKRDRFSRNNVLHLWPFVINDLRALGAKKFFGKFCAGSIDHISIRQVQCILLKVALLLGVEIHENVAFEELIEPPEDQSIRTGWKAKFTPADHPVSQYEFDVLIGADGKRNTLQGFKRKEFRGRLAIAITANFVNRRSEAEARVEEISGVAFIFNQKFFRELYQATGIDLENIVYYKDETHYFVMTAKKHSLINKGVIIKDYPDTATLLSPENVNREALMDYAREAADFSTNYQLPHLDFAVNHYGKPDVAMFDFTSMFAAENASRMIERRGHKLLMQLVGDSLLEPFWPTGSGCARGFLSSFDACWAIRSMSSGRMTALEVLAERESIYRLLAQTTPENLNKDHSAYTLEPQTRYPNLNTKAVLPFQVKSLFDTDNPAALEQPALSAPQEEGVRKRMKRSQCLIHQDALLAWLKKQVALYPDVEITDLTTSFKSGLALCAIVHRYRPDLIDFAVLDPDNHAANNQLAFDILEELGISPMMTGLEMAQCYVPDKLSMMSYLTQVYDLFRSEIPHVRHSKMEVDELEDDAFSVPKTSTRRYGSSARTSTKAPTGVKRRSAEKAAGEPRDGATRALVDRKMDSMLRKAKKRRSHEKTLERSETRQEIASNREERKQRFAAAQKLRFARSMQMLSAELTRGGSEAAEPNKDAADSVEDFALFLYRLDSDFEDKKRRLQRLLFSGPDRENKPSAKGDGSDALINRARDLEAKFRGAQGAEKKPKDLIRAIGKIDKTDWNLQLLEKKREENQLPGSSAESKVPKWNKDAFSDKFEAINKRLHGLPVEAKNEKVLELEQNVKRLERKLKEGSSLEVGQRGSNKVSAMAEQLKSRIVKEDKESTKPGVTKSNSRPVLNIPSQGGSENCHFCKKRVYLMERMSAEGKFFHRGCFRCEYCATVLRLGGYGYVRDDVLGGLFFCTTHVSMAYYLRTALLKKRDESDTASFHQAKDKTSAVRTTLTSPYAESGLAKGGAALRDQRSPVQLEEDFLRGGTPERVEFENSIEAETVDDEASEIDEDEWTDHNFGSSVLDSSEEMSSSDGSSTDGDEEEITEDDDDVEAPDRPRQSQAHKLADQAAQVPNATQDRGDGLENVNEQGDEINEVRLDVPQKALLAVGKSKNAAGAISKRYPVSDEYSTEEYCEEEEEEEEDCEEEGQSEYEEDEDIEEEEEEEDSATEIETDSEFDHNSNVDVRSAPQEIPTIIINESEQLKSSNEQLINGNDSKRPVNADPDPKYVAQYVSLENPRPGISKTREDRSSSMSNIPSAISAAPRSGILAYLRRHELMDSAPSVDMVAARNAHELKKRYLQGSSESMVRNSASATSLDSKFKNFVDHISEAQKLLNPAPQPSPSMQVFLKSTEKIFPKGPSPSARFGLATSSAVPETKQHSTISGPQDVPETANPEAVQDKGGSITAAAAAAVAASLGEDKPAAESTDSSDTEGDSDCLAESMDGDTATDLGTDSGTESTSLLESVNDLVRGEDIVPVVEARNVVFNSIVEEEETDRSGASEQPAEATCDPLEKEGKQNEEFEQLHFEEQESFENGFEEPSATDLPVEDQCGEEPVTNAASVPAEKHIALQEDFDLGLSSDQSEAILGVPNEESESKGLARPKSKESLDSSKMALTETELSDFAEESLNTDFGLDLKDASSVAGKETAAASCEGPAAPRVTTVLCNLDDLDFADKSDAASVLESPPRPAPRMGSSVKAAPKTDLPPLDIPPPVPVSSLPSSPEASVLKTRDVFDWSRIRKTPIHNSEPVQVVKREPAGRTMDQSHRSSPGLLRKKEALSMERERQSDLVREMVLSRIQRSPEKGVRRGSYGSLTPPRSGSVSRSGSESRTLDSVLAKSEPSPTFVQPEFKSCAAASFQVRSLTTEARPHSVAIDCTSATAALLMPLDLKSTAQTQPPPKPPRLIAIETPRSQLEQQAAAKPIDEQDLITVESPPPPEVRKSIEEEDRTVARQTRMRSFSEPDPPKPPSPKSDLIHGLFLTQTASPVSMSRLSSPSLSPQFAEPVKASSFPGISVSAAESEGKLSAQSTPTRSTTQKKPKDRERRRSLIQAITGLFTKSNEKESETSPKKTKETQKAVTPKSPTLKDKFPLLKLPTKSKTKEDNLKVADDMTSRERASSSPSSPSQPEDISRGRSISLQHSPESEAAHAASPSAGLENSQSAGATSLKRNPKQERQSMRQAELKRLRMAQSIQRQLEEIEVKQKELEEQGVRLEKTLRGEEEIAEGDEASLMQEWFQLVHEKNALGRYEQELVIRARELELEDRHARLQQELAKTGSEEARKSAAEVEKENQLVREMLDITEQLDNLRAALEEDRQRYREQDKDLEAQMLAKGLRLTSLRQRKESQV